MPKFWVFPRLYFLQPLWVSVLVFFNSYLFPLSLTEFPLIALYVLCFTSFCCALSMCLAQCSPHPPIRFPLILFKAEQTQFSHLSSVWIILYPPYCLLINKFINYFGNMDSMGISTERVAKCKVNDLYSGPFVFIASHFFLENDGIMHRWKIHAVFGHILVCIFCYLNSGLIEQWPHNPLSLNSVGAVIIEVPCVAVHIPC